MDRCEFNAVEAVFDTVDAVAASLIEVPYCHSEQHAVSHRHVDDIPTASCTSYGEEVQEGIVVVERAGGCLGDGRLAI